MFMRYPRRYGIALIAVIAVMMGFVIGERSTRSWRVPAYRVVVPKEFDVEPSVIVRPDSEEFVYSPRDVYLEYHREGWDMAKATWLTGDNKRNWLRGVSGPVNQALRDGRNQFNDDAGLTPK